PDLLDRTIPQHLTKISKAQRKTEQEFWAAFAVARPRLIGAMFDALSAAMRLYPTVRPPELPRMADFGVWGYAVAEAIGMGGPTFLRAYTDAIGTQTQAALDNHAVATAVIALGGGRDEIAAEADGHVFWSGSASDLLTQLDEIAADQRLDIRSKS